MKIGLLLRKRIVFVSIAALFGILSLEGVACLLLSGRIQQSVVPQNIGQFDEMLGWSLKPFSYGVSNRTGYEIAYRINSKGLRDDETSYERPEDIFRIVLLGDSRTFGFGVPIEKHFSTLLEGYFKNVEVINMGVNGFGVDQELLYLRLEGFRYKPHLVLAYIAHYEDHRHMHTERFGSKKPRFLLVDGDLVLSNSPVVFSQKSPSNLRKIHQYLVIYSNAYSAFERGIKYLIKKEPQENQGHKQNKEDKKNLQNEEFRKKLYDIGNEILYAMHKESIEHGANFVLVTQIKELHKAALERKIFSLDVTRPLSNHKFSLPDDLGHINESGNGVLAWEIVKFLQVNQLIPINNLSSSL